jgi:DNA polymerase-1
VLKDPKGRPVNALYIFTKLLLGIEKEYPGNTGAMLFDCGKVKFRLEIAPEYKANRPDYSSMQQEESPFSQINDVYAALDEMHIRWVETDGCEADDVIAGYALDDEFDGEVIISSFDSDFFQLITDRVSILRYHGEHTMVWNEEYFRWKFGIKPSQYADFKCLTGDAADNIVGAKKVGRKTAARLLNEYGTLENLLQCADSIRQPSIRGSILESKDRLLLNQCLIKLKGDTPLPFPIESLVYTNMKKTTGQVLGEINIR